MIVWVGNEFDTTLFGYVGYVIAQLFKYLTPIALAWLTIRVLLYGFKVLRGGVCEPVLDFAASIITAAVIVGFATSGAIYHEFVIDVYNAATLDMVKTFSPPGTPLADAHNVWAVIEGYNDKAGDLTSQAVSDGIFSIQIAVALIAVLFFSFGSAFFILAAILITVMTKGFGTFILAIGPVFILFLLFEQTRQWFVNWLGTALGLAVLTWLAFFLLGFSIALQIKIVEAISKNIGQINVLTQAILYFVISLVFAVLLWQAPAFVQGLTGGAATQMGVQMVTQLYHAFRKGRASTPAADMAGGTSNTATRHHGWAYRAGDAVGRSTGVQWAFQRLAAAGRR
jgi:type IV secretion system protein VirB6